MARMIFPDGKESTDFQFIQTRLGRLGITLKRWPAPEGARAKALLEQQALNDDEKEELLKSVDNRFEELKRDKGYSTRDMIVIHEHTDDEVRYILSGKGYFGFVEPDGQQFLLEVAAGDYINVPANAEHWFEMKDSKRIKAVRYFIDTKGWTPVYTQRAMLFG
jgi:1,2-dihydroxy-3-keto-5-methylthiopentene dioxygenase